MKYTGIVKSSLVILLDFLFFGSLFGNYMLAFLVSGGILLFAYFGEHISVKKDGAIDMKYLEDYQRLRLESIKDYLIEDVKRVSELDISGLSFYLVPSDELNAYAYGRRCIGVTQGLLNVCDDITVCSVLGHEICHTLCLDAVFHRVILANVTLAMLWLSLASALSIGMLGLVIFIFCLFGACGGFTSFIIFRGMKKLLNGFFLAMQHGLLLIYQLLMGLVSRRAEYRADSYSCQLGYGFALSNFLTRYIQSQETRPKSISEILYGSHPDTHKRVFRITQQTTSHDIVAKVS